MEKFSKLKLLGHCFGHQLLIRAYKGEVIRKDRIAGVERIRFDEELVKNNEFLSPIKGFHLNYLALNEYHNDFLGTIPENFIPLATSDTCEVEAMISKDTRMLCFQFHPEFSIEYTGSYETRIDSYEKPGSIAGFGNGKSSKEHEESIWCMR